jgi:hypothetical protein
VRVKEEWRYTKDWPYQVLSDSLGRLSITYDCLANLLMKIENKMAIQHTDTGIHPWSNIDRRLYCINPYITAVANPCR